VHELFAAQAAGVPDAVAVSCGDEQVTFGELETRANRLAHFLRGAGAGPESVVGLCLPRGVAMVTAVLAVLKSGAAYLPVDPGYPAERIAFMLADSRVAVVAGTAGALDELPAGRARAVAVDDPATGAAVAGCPASPPPAAVGPQALAYVIYTSGSTGAPKGVMVTHGGLANYVGWAGRAVRRERRCTRRWRST